MKRLLFLCRYGLSSLALAAGLSACGDPIETVTISGSTTVLPAISKAAEQYQADTGQIIVVNAGGSGSGFNQLAQGLTHIGMMSRDITEEEKAQFPDFKFTQIAIGRDAVVPVISSEIYDAGVTTLSFSQIKDIYSGKVDNWAVYGGPDSPIFAIDKEKSRGTRQTFFKYVAGDKNFQALGADLVTGSNNEKQTAVAQSNAAIGMLSVAWLNADVKGLSVELEDGTVIEPTLQNIRNGEFPISRNLEIVIRDDIAPKAQNFVDYVLSPEGQKFVEASGYVPLHAPVVTSYEARGSE